MKGTARFLPTDRIADWVTRLMGDRAVLATQPGSPGPVVAPVSDPARIDLSLDARRSSIRDLWMPQTEVLFRYALGAEGTRIEAAAREGLAKVVLGLRPCEAAGIRRVAHVMRGGGRPDPLGLEAERMAIVTLFCESPRRTCFCGAVGCPVAMAEEGSDIVLTPVTDGFVAHLVTPLGEEVAQAGAFAPVTADQEAAARALHDRLGAMTRSEPSVRALEGAATDYWEESAFATHAARCVGCGICTYLCPSCHCFDILDDRRGLEGRRYRCWDSCQFGHFTLHASRHNPRPNQAARLRQRVLHKFLYMPGEFGVVGCTGCGRCAELCPVGISILDVAGQLRGVRQDAEVSEA